jgi:hypothetical protein
VTFDCDQDDDGGGGDVEKDGAAYDAAAAVVDDDDDDRHEQQHLRFPNAIVIHPCCDVVDDFEADCRRHSSAAEGG